jgi:ABC-2 type transport system permease protein
MTATTAPARSLPGSIPMGLRRGRMEIRAWFRNRAAVVFSLALPIALMLLFGSLFTAQVNGSRTSLKELIVAGVLASGVMSAAFGSLTFGIVMDREDGTLRRLMGTPFTLTAYFISKTLVVLMLALIQAVLVMGVAAIAFHIHPPTSAHAWLTLAWVFVLGVVGNAFLGIAVGSMLANSRSAGAVVQFPVIVLQFISGVYYPVSSLPKGLQYVGAVFPLKWMAQGMRSALLPASWVNQEPAHSWEHPETAIILGAWTVIGFLLCVLAQRWRMHREFR